MTCTKCKQTKARDEFPGHITSKRWCRACRAEADLIRRFNITQSQYDIILAKQNGTCAICFKPETRLTASGNVVKLSVDHDHACCPGRNSCGKCVRGLLCERCNRSIGLFEENADLLGSAITYIRSYTNDSSSNRRSSRPRRFSNLFAKKRRVV